MIGRVKVDSIPAGWEEDLSTKAIGASDVGKRASVCEVRIGAEADETDGLASKVISVVTLERISSKHAEAFRVGSQVVVVWTTSLAVRLLAVCHVLCSLSKEATYR